MTKRTNRVTISGGTFTGSAIGNENVQVTSVHGAEEVTVGGLRATLADARAEIVALGEDARQRARLRSGIDQVEEELRTEQPDGDVVRGSWKRVLRLLDAAGQASESVARIGQAITSLFPA
jgi:hypothetical protein